MSDPTPKHAHMFHLVQVPEWTKAASATPAVYFPPTYADDGFTHLTADPALLLNVANQFYRSIPPDVEWRVLVLDAARLQEKSGGEIKYEPAAPVGAIAARKGDEGLLYPHLYGGIPAGGGEGVVLAELAVRREPGEGGAFVAIEGLEAWGGAAGGGASAGGGDGK